MDMLERYLQAVRFFLPASQQDDIIRELSENLISRMEDREEELGHPLDEAEQAAIIRAHGHPMVVAGRYRARTHLIGPTFFPLYIFVLKMGLGVALLVSIVLAVITSALHGDPIRRVLEAMLAFPGRGLMVFAWTTLGFAALDFAQAHVRLGHDWDPRTLPEGRQRGATHFPAEDAMRAVLHAGFHRMAAVAASVTMADSRAGRRPRAVHAHLASGVRADGAPGAGHGDPVCRRFRTPVSDELP